MDMQKELIDCNNWILEQDDDFVSGYGQGNYALGLARLAWQAAKAQAVPEGFVLVSAEQMSQWGHMANCAQEYGCPECYESRGYAHSLACEINAYFNVSEAQHPSSTSDCPDEP